MSVKKITSKS